MKQIKGIANLCYTLLSNKQNQLKIKFILEKEFIKQL